MNSTSSQTSQSTMIGAGGYNSSGSLMNTFSGVSNGSSSSSSVTYMTGFQNTNTISSSGFSSTSSSYNPSMGQSSSFQSGPTLNNNNSSSSGGGGNPMGLGMNTTGMRMSGNMSSSSSMNYTNINSNVQSSLSSSPHIPTIKPPSQLGVPGTIGPGGVKKGADLKMFDPFS